MSTAIQINTKFMFVVGLYEPKNQNFVTEISLTERIFLYSVGIADLKSTPPMAGWRKTSPASIRITPGSGICVPREQMEIPSTDF